MSEPLSRQDRLEKINGILAEYRLPPWKDARLGDPAEGQCEVLDLADLQELGDRRIALTLRVRDPLGEERRVTVNVGGALVYVVPLLNLLDGEDAGNGPMCCFVKRWRIEHGEFSYELPHALVPEGSLGGTLDPMDSPSHRVLAAAFGPESVDALTAAKIVPVGTFRVKGEARPAEAYILAATVLKPFMRRKGDGAVVKLAWPKVAPLVESGKHVTEPVSAAALHLALRMYPPQKKNER
ncbi:MAG TPA: hypothetical protein VL426_06985 [Candidatus Binatia bacterium]|nr:hypothetical protein [Candidatus Binatia bacterium]